MLLQYKKRTKRVNDPAPTKGLVVLSSYNINSRRGEFRVIDIETTELVAQKEFINAITSDSVIAVLGICAAGQFYLDNGYTEKIYCSNVVSYIWAAKKQIKSKASSTSMRELAIEKLKVFDSLDFTKSVKSWNQNWGNMRQYLHYLDRMRNPSKII
jgi:hypothetical protein